MLEAISGLVTLGLLGLSAVIGVRLLRLSPWGSGSPEKWLGLYFLTYSALATGLSVGTYVGWSSAEIALSAGVARALNAGFFAASTLGLACLLVFTQRTFRRASLAGRALVWATIGVMGAAFVALGVTEGFEVRVLNGPPYWIHWAARLVGWIWVGAESFAYWSKQRRRLAIGLADPIVTNRFLLWGVWGALMAVMACADPLARVWYFRLAATTTSWVPEIGRPIIQVVVPLTCGFNIGAVLLLVLTFFPTAGYKRWLAARYAVRV